MNELQRRLKEINMRSAENDPLGAERSFFEKYCEKADMETGEGIMALIHKLRASAVLPLGRIDDAKAAYYTQLTLRYGNVSALLDYLSFIMKADYPICGKEAVPHVLRGLLIEDAKKGISGDDRDKSDQERYRKIIDLLRNASVDDVIDLIYYVANQMPEGLVPCTDVISAIIEDAMTYELLNPWQLFSVLAFAVEDKLIENLEDEVANQMLLRNS